MALKQVTLWTMIKTRRWEWLEELFAAQPGRLLTLSALLTYSQGLREEHGVRRKHLRLAAARREMDVERKDSRSKRLLPVAFVEGQEVEALFMKVGRDVCTPCVLKRVLSIKPWKR